MRREGEREAREVGEREGGDAQASNRAGERYGEGERGSVHTREEERERERNRERERKRRKGEEVKDMPVAI